MVDQKGAMVKSGLPGETVSACVDDIRVQPLTTYRFIKQVFFLSLNSGSPLSANLEPGKSTIFRSEDAFGRSEVEGAEANTSDHCDRLKHLSVKQRCCKTYFYYHPNSNGGLKMTK